MPKKVKLEAERSRIAVHQLRLEERLLHIDAELQVDELLKSENSKKALQIDASGPFVIREAV